MGNTNAKKKSKTEEDSTDVYWVEISDPKENGMFLLVKRNNSDIIKGVKTLGIGSKNLHFEFCCFKIRPEDILSLVAILNPEVRKICHSSVTLTQNEIQFKTGLNSFKKDWNEIYSKIFTLWILFMDEENSHQLKICSQKLTECTKNFQ